MNHKTKQRLSRNPIKWIINFIKRLFTSSQTKPLRKGLGMLLLVNAQVLKSGSPAFVDNIKRKRVRPAKINKLDKKHNINITLAELSLKDIDPNKEKVFVPSTTRLYPRHKVKQLVIMDIETHEIFIVAPNEMTRRDTIIEEGTVIPYVETSKGYAKYNPDDNKVEYKTTPETYKYYKQAINGLMGFEITNRQKIEINFTLNLPG